MNKMNDKNLPSFLVIGATKAGTTWLYQRLLTHTELWLPPVKELHYFDVLYPRPEFNKNNQTDFKKNIFNKIRRNLKKHIVSKENLDRDYIMYLMEIIREPIFSLEWYISCFSNDHAKSKICGEVTPSYATLPSDGILYLKKILPNVKIIYLVRDPVERAASHVKMIADMMTKNNKQADLMSLCDHPRVVASSNYKSIIPLWREYFDDKDFLIMPFEKIQSDPRGFLKSIKEFLVLDNDFDDLNLTKKANEGSHIDLPPGVMNKLESKFKSQRDYILQELGN
tara:strand:+ start:757 stop:1602 length:846 start_codon:yes stop_codon:yes gene_type:complete